MTQKQNTMHLLIIDDHAMIRKGLRSILELEFPGAVITDVDNGEKALIVVENQPLDAITLDLSLRGKSGLDVLKAIKNLKPEIPVIMFSMHDREQYADRCLTAGASAYLTKDEAPEVLKDALLTVINGDIYRQPSLSARLTDMQ